MCVCVCVCVCVGGVVEIPISDVQISDHCCHWRENLGCMCRYVAWQHCHRRVVLGWCSETSPVKHSAQTSRLHSAQNLSTCSGRWKTPGPDICVSKPLSFSKFCTQTLKSEESYVSHHYCTTHIWGPNQTRGAAILKGVKGLHWKVIMVNYEVLVRMRTGTEGVFAKKRCGLSVRTSFA